MRSLEAVIEIEFAPEEDRSETVLQTPRVRVVEGKQVDE